MRTAASRRPGWLRRGEVVWLLHAIVKDVVLRASEWIEDSKHSRTARYRGDLIPLLAEILHLRAKGRLLSLMVVRGNRAETHRVELLCGSCDICKLLLKFSLLLRKTGIRSQQFSIQALIKLPSMVVDLNSGRSKDLLWTQVHLLVEVDIIVVVCTGEESARGSLRDSSVIIGVLRRRISAALEAKAVITR